MSIFLTPLTSSPPTAHAGRANFGNLISAVRGNDIEAAKAAFDALSADPKARGWGLRLSLQAVGEALKAEDIDAAATALKNLHSSQSSKGHDGARVQSGSGHSPVASGVRRGILI